MAKTGHISTLSVPNHDEMARGTLRSLVARAGLGEVSVSVKIPMRLGNLMAS